MSAHTKPEAGAMPVIIPRLEVERLRSQVAALEQLLDVHERTSLEQADRLEQALDDRQALLVREHAVVESALDCVIGMDHEGRITQFNPAAVRTFGHSRADALGKDMAELVIPPRLREAHRAGLAHYLATGEGPVLGKRMELSAVRADGTEFPVELAIIRLPVDGPPLFVSYLRDLTEPRRAEDALRQRAGQLRGLAQAAVAINSARSEDEILRVITEQARRVIGAHQAVTNLTVNQHRAQAIHAVSLSEKYAAWQSYVERPDGLPMYALVCEPNRPARMTQEELEAHPSWRGVDKEPGRQPPMRGLLAAPVVGRDGGNVGLIQLSDKHVGEFSESDEDILVQLAQMASAAVENARLYWEAEAARGEAERANQAKSDFLAGMSHELRTPLNAIGGYAALMEDGVPGDINEKQREYLRRIRRSQQHLLGLINDVLNFAKLDAGHIAFRIEDVRLGEALLEVGVMVDPQVRSKQLVFQLVPGDPAVFVRADRDKLLQVMLNLVSNAIKFTGPAGRITLAWDADEREARIRVTDTGIGIAPDHQAAIFEPFVQADRTHAAEGTGLGLAISRGLARAMEGDLTVASVPGEGATFTLTLAAGRESSCRDGRGPVP